MTLQSVSSVVNPHENNVAACAGTTACDRWVPVSVAGCYLRAPSGAGAKMQLRGAIGGVSGY
jgi:hypothetical protein